MEEHRYRLNSFELRAIGNNYYSLEPLTTSSEPLNKLITLNSTAALVWRELSSGGDFNERTIVKILMSHYGISEDIASNDSFDLIHAWEKAGVIASY